MKKVCILWVLITYVYHDARFRKHKALYLRSTRRRMARWI